VHLEAAVSDPTAAKAQIPRTKEYIDVSYSRYGQILQSTH
jgi:hypothetical protein